jgi:opacity protein-like surface antigen
MRKSISLICASLLAAVALPSIAKAQTYVGVSTGLSIQNDSKNRGEFTATVPAVPAVPATVPPTNAFAAIPNATSLAWDTKFDNGYNISAFAGHRFNGGFRVEGELAYSRNGIDSHRNVTVGGAIIDGVDVGVLTRAQPAATNPTVGEVVNSGIGKIRHFGGFLNAYYDFNSEGSFQPYVGAGAGLQNVKVDFRPSDVDVGQGNKTKFAYQLMAGATYKMGPGLEIFGQYNYRAVDGRSKIALDLLPADLGVQSKQSIISLGLRIPFGGDN